MNKTLVDRLVAALAILSIAFLSFVAGAAVYKWKVFPYPLMYKAYLGASAYYERYLKPTDRYIEYLWRREARGPEKGVTRYDEEKAYDGLTLFTSAHAQSAFLIEMDGRVVHEWHLPFRAVWNDPPHVDDPVPPEHIYFRRAHVFPNGDLLAMYVGTGDTPWGYGLVKMDKGSRLIWKYPERVHHDFDVGEDGRIYALVHRISNTKVPGARKINPPFIDDSIVIFSPDGEELRRINVIQAFLNSKFRNTLAFVREYYRDPLHTNTVKVVTGDIVAAHPYAEVGQILICMRDIDTIALVDPELEKVVWAIRGPWRAPHDPDFLDNGHMLIFDNLGHIGPGGRSRVIEFDPLTLETYWSYTGDEERVFFSKARSVQQRLPNGNTLITESDGGRIFEVNPEKEIVWEYISPHRGGEREQYIPVVSGGQRIARSALLFLEE
jgi:hypothetical protein